MDKLVVKNAIAILSANDIKPYDLLLALGEEDIVPEDIVANRKQRASSRDGSPSPKAYIRNAIEDLSKLNFDQKNFVIKSLKETIGDVSALSGFAATKHAPSNLLFWAAVIGLLFVAYRKVA